MSDRDRAEEASASRRHERLALRRAIDRTRAREEDEEKDADPGAAESGSTAGSTPASVFDILDQRRSPRRREED